MEESPIPLADCMRATATKDQRREVRACVVCVCVQAGGGGCDPARTRAHLGSLTLCYGCSLGVFSRRHGLGVGWDNNSVQFGFTRDREMVGYRTATNDTHDSGTRGERTHRRVDGMGQDAPRC